MISFCNCSERFSHKSMDSSYCSFTGYWWNSGSELRLILFSGPLWTCSTPTLSWRWKCFIENVKLCEHSKSKPQDLFNLESTWLFHQSHSTISSSEGFRFGSFSIDSLAHHFVILAFTILVFFVFGFFFPIWTTSTLFKRNITLFLLYFWLALARLQLKHCDALLQKM